MYLYIIRSDNSSKFYIGITNNPSRRIATHKHAAKHKRTRLYDWIKKHKDWELVIVNEYSSREEAKNDEIFWISFGSKNGWPLLNLAKGGEGGFVVTDIEDWKSKLRAARKGRTPALGMKHNQATKEFCSKKSREYWDSQETYDISVTTIPFKDARKRYGISKTHYYRLKRAASSERC